MSNDEKATYPHLTRRQELLLALAVAVVTANAYYIHPIIRDVADGFGISDAQIGIVPALNQLALAIGILLLLPLGDRYSNRNLTIVFTAGQCLGLALMTLAPGFVLFTTGSTLLGFFTIAPYLLPAYASKRVAPERLGHVTATLTAGILFGILVARVGAGVVAEHFGWRTVYWAATIAMVAIAIALPRIMPKSEVAAPKEAKQPYLQLVLSVFPLLRSHPEIIISGAIQAIGFGQFIALWLALALHLTSPEMGYGTDAVGYLAGFAALSVLTTPRLGKWSDRIGPRRARLYLALIQTAGTALLLPFGGSIWLLMIPILITSTVGPAIDVGSRMTFLSKEPALRTRLTTIYIVIMFIGGGAFSFLGPAIFDAFGWDGIATAVLICCAALTALCALALKLYGSGVTQLNTA
ncbi:MFS transporter [Erythrobacter sp. F6033]|uniref:MFS transporter n=1 Tax=Erythrobacter sp. F6033 TaxID=2926401 RepID=UPI001FF6B63C|nr:MFS transporter [Erythrobacter sp. F6033]MCK0128322.1 MFS transporter [Erythrobacter sp. F6033]